MSNEARHRYSASLLARGVIRVKKQPTFAKIDKSTTPAEQASSCQPHDQVQIELHGSLVLLSDGGGRLAVRYRNGGRLGDPIRSWIDLGDHLLTDHLSHWLMDHANRGLIARNHYKVDRLSRSLLDFARVMETFDKFNVSFVSATQRFNTTHSMGQLTLKVLLSFTRFEREIIGERIRDKLAAQCRRGQWTGG